MPGYRVVAPRESLEEDSDTGVPSGNCAASYSAARSGRYVPASTRPARERTAFDHSPTYPSVRRASAAPRKTWRTRWTGLLPDPRASLSMPAYVSSLRLMVVSVLRALRTATRTYCALVRCAIACVRFAEAGMNDVLRRVHDCGTASVHRLCQI